MSYRIYGNVFYRRWMRHRVARQHMRPMDIECVPNGIIVNEHEHGFGVFDEHARFQKSSSQIRENNGQFIPKFSRENIPFVDADVVFVGNVMPQFGHFLLEHMNRAYAFLKPEFQGKKAVLVDNKNIAGRVPEYMYELLGYLGVARDDVIILTHTTRFRNVFIPRQGYNLPVWSSSEFAATYDAIARAVAPRVRPTQKIYVSRAKLGMRRTYGEEKIQEIFRKNGYKIIYPETMPLRDQIAAARGATHLAGCAGTALHLALFMQAGGTVIQIKRNKPRKDNSPTQELINSAAGLNGVYIDASIERVGTEHGDFAPQIIGVTKHMKKFFDDNGFKYSAADLAPDTDAWREYSVVADEYARVHGGGFAISCKRKLVRISALFIPGRERRGRWRRWLKNKLHIV